MCVIFYLFTCPSIQYSFILTAILEAGINAQLSPFKGEGNREMER